MLLLSLLLITMFFFNGLQAPALNKLHYVQNSAAGALTHTICNLLISHPCCISYNASLSLSAFNIDYFLLLSKPCTVLLLPISFWASPYIPSRTLWSSDSRRLTVPHIFFTSIHIALLFFFFFYLINHLFLKEIIKIIQFFNSCYIMLHTCFVLPWVLVLFTLNWINKIK